MSNQFRIIKPLRLPIPDSNILVVTDNFLIKQVGIHIAKIHLINHNKHSKTQNKGRKRYQNHVRVSVCYTLPPLK